MSPVRCKDCGKEASRFYNIEYQSPHPRGLASTWPWALCKKCVKWKPSQMINRATWTEISQDEFTVLEVLNR